MGGNIHSVLLDAVLLKSSILPLHGRSVQELLALQLERESAVNIANLSLASFESLHGLGAPGRIDHEGNCRSGFNGCPAVCRKGEATAIGFNECCNTVHWGAAGWDGCWDAGGSFQHCCVGTLLSACVLGCDARRNPLVSGVSENMCRDGFKVHVCDLGSGPPRIRLYVQWSRTYFSSLAWMLRSLRYAEDSVRVVLREVMDTRNVSTGDQFSWGSTGYLRQRAVRATWFQSIVRANYNRAVVVSDTDVEYYPGWLELLQNCLRKTGSDFCVGQQAGLWSDRESSLNPGFIALIGNGRTLAMFQGMASFVEKVDGGYFSELAAFNTYVNQHPPELGGPSFAVFHPEVASTGVIKGMCQIEVCSFKNHEQWRTNLKPTGKYSWQSVTFHENVNTHENHM